MDMIVLGVMIAGVGIYHAFGNPGECDSFSFDF